MTDEKENGIGIQAADSRIRSNETGRIGENGCHEEIKENGKETQQQ
jgi:hypothetical protein